MQTTRDCISEQLKAEPADDARQIEVRYRELCASIRQTDEISFKLLGFVPLISGASIFTFILTRIKIAVEPNPIP